MMAHGRTGWGLQWTLFACLLMGMQACGGAGADSGGEGLGEVPDFSGSADVTYAFPDGSGSGGGAEVGLETSLENSDTGDDSGDEIAPQLGEESGEEVSGEGEEAGEGSEDPGEDTGDDSGVEETGPADVGDPCGPGIAICVEGTTCIEVAVGASEKTCHEDALPGEPCGPGVAPCVEGSLCAEDASGEESICQVIQDTGASCGAAGETCAAGDVCVPMGPMNGFGWSESWTPGNSSNGAWNAPEDVAVDSLGRVWIADTGQGRLVSFDGDGAVLGELDLAALSGGAEVSPVGLDVAGEIVVADAAGKQLLIFGMDGAWNGTLGGPGAGDGLFGDGGPGDVRVQQLIVGDDVIGATAHVTVPEDGRVDIFTAFGAGTALSAAGWQGSMTGDGSPLIKPQGIGGSSAHVWVADEGAGLVRGWASEGVAAGAATLVSLGGPGPDEGGLIAPTGVAVDAESRVFVADPAAGHVAVFDASGEFLWSVQLPGGDFAPRSVALIGDRLVVVDAENDAVHLFAPTMEAICVAPAGAGEACGDGEVPCAAGLQCVPTHPGSPNSICKSIQGENAPCGDAVEVCGEGLDCVMGDAASGWASICLAAGEVGTSCGPGVGGCVAGASCNWDGPAHGIRQCYPDLALGEVCNGYGAGDCPAGSSCVQEIPGSSTLVCRAWLSEGEACNSAGSCPPWRSCSYDSSPVDTRCLPFQPEGASCGLQVGDCEPGTNCMFTDAGQTTVACLGPEADGDSCAGPGEGLCDESTSTCQAVQSGGPYQCMENAGQSGDACGVGLSPCSAGTTCIYDDPPPARSTLSCFPHGAELGAPCGIGHGPCDPALGLGCGEVDANYQGLCQPRQPLFAPCGESAGGEGACSLLDSACVCSDPTLSPEACDATQLLCVPVVERYDMCAVLASSFSEDATTGWVGLCPSDHVCVAGAGVEGDHFFYYCKPVSNVGEPCGMFHGCAAGLACICPTGQACTLDEIQVGNMGTCTLN